MRVLSSQKFAKAAASCALAGGLVLALYTFSSPSGSVERGPAAASGHAVVVDGDTVDIAGRRVRLEGIDAPELGQRCPRSFGWGAWPAGRQARQALIGLIARRPVTCRARGLDQYGRMLGVCFAGGIELNGAMVQRGMAWAFRRYSTSYVAAEQDARSNRIGIWQTRCAPAWEYRQARWLAGAAAAPRGCAIKGNITKAGRIYHMPWSPWYRKTKIEPQKGERWFCDEPAAQAAGWRPAVPRTGGPSVR